MDPNNKKIYPIINPWKYKPSLANLKGAAAEEKKLTIIGDDTCNKCHDLDNSVHFKIEPYWKAIAHPTPAGGGEWNFTEAAVESNGCNGIDPGRAISASCFAERA